MENDDKATTRIPDSPAQDFIHKVDKRDQLVRTIELFLLIAVLAFNIVTTIRQQVVIAQNQAGVVTARQQNIDRQNQLKDYIKCLSLIRFNVPPVDVTSRQAVSDALDTCAKAND